MCGILGGNNKKWNYKAGIECMHHRGPDGTKIKSMDDFTMAFSRLAIMDLSENGMQPMVSEDNQVIIVFNGEIYGYKKLRDELIQKGYTFHSTSDTEVILNAYLEWGERFVTKVDGMFGIAIYDRREEVVRLFRDRVGIKPLYYFFDGQNFGFSSELKGIVNMCSTVSLEVDNTAVYDYLNYLYIPDPKTYYKNVFKLQPGHRMIFDVKHKRIVKNTSYWRLNVNTKQSSQRKQDDLVEELRELIKESVSEQMVADVPVGTFLSGGVDSSIITYECHNINPQLETFSIGFSRSDFNELKYACELSEKYHINMNSKIFNRDTYQRIYSNMKLWYDEPFADTSAYPTYFVSKLAKEKVTVVLTGDGGDEVFGGYPRQGLMQKRERNKAPDNRAISFMYSKISHNKVDYFWLDDLTFLLRSNCWVPETSDKQLRKCLGIPRDYDMFWAFRKYYIKELPPMTRVQYLDLMTYLPGDILTKVDRVSMAVSLETRVPFLSKKIIEFAFSLPEEDRCPNGAQKGLLKRAYEKEFGKRYLNRRKMGFSIPYSLYGDRLSPQEQLLEKLWD